MKFKYIFFVFIFLFLLGSIASVSASCYEDISTVSIDDSVLNDVDAVGTFDEDLYDVSDSSNSKLKDDGDAEKLSLIW